MPMGMQLWYFNLNPQLWMGLCWQFLQGLGASGSTMTLKYSLWLFKAIDSYGYLILDNRLKQTGLRQAQLNWATQKDPFSSGCTCCELGWGYYSQWYLYPRWNCSIYCIGHYMRVLLVTSVEGSQHRICTVHYSPTFNSRITSQLCPTQCCI